MGSYRNLILWQKSMDLVVEVYKLIRLLPKEETFALGSQMRRSAISIPSNIAEGQARNSDKEFTRFLSIAQESKAEIETQLEICTRLGYLNTDQTANAMSISDEIGKMLNVMLNNRKQSKTDN